MQSEMTRVANASTQEYRAAHSLESRAEVCAMARWFSLQFQKFNLVPEYFRAIAKEWNDIIFGETLVAILFVLWWALANPSNHRLILVFVVAMFLAGYYAWRADHVRLMPKFEATEFDRNDARTVDGHFSSYYQILPKCISAANVEECVAFLTSIEMQDLKTGEWKVKQSEALPLEWSFGEQGSAHLPVTLYSGGAERRLNVFVIHFTERRIRPCTSGAN
jgi:hypothetical protein